MESKRQNLVNQMDKINSEPTVDTSGSSSEESSSPENQRPAGTDENPNETLIDIEVEKLQSPPDGGYGWLVVLGTFVTHVIIGALERSEGVFFLQFQNKFHQSAQLTAWPGAISSTIRMMMGPISSAISNRLSVRTCTFMGSSLLSLALFLNGFAPDFFFLFFSHGILQGLGHGLSYAPSLIIIGMYFDKKRGLAAGLASAGVGFGTFVFLPIIQILFDTYGFSGTFLILSAWSLHSAVVAMLHRPLRLHYKFSQASNRREGLQDSTNHNENNGNECEVTDTLNVDENSQPPTKSLNNELELYRHEILSVPKESKIHKCTDCMTSSFQICFPVEDKRYVKQTKNKVFHFYLLKNPSFLLFCGAIMLFTAANKSSLTFLPALVRDKGFSDTEAAFVISIMGGFDTVGRMGTGFLFDFNRLRPFRPLFYNVFLFMIAVIAFLLPSMDTYVSLCIVAAIFGLLCGGYISQKSVIIVDMLGAQNMASSFGMLICFQGVGSGIGPPLSGFFKDIFGSFTEVFYLGGSIMTIAGTFMIFCNLFLRKQQKMSKSKERDSRT